MPHAQITACSRCDAPIALDGHIGRPPVYCSATCRRARYAEGARQRRQERKREIQRLRELVNIYEAALAA